MLDTIGISSIICDELCLNLQHLLCMCCFVSFVFLVSFLLGLRRLRGWRYTLMVAASLLLALACDVYHGQFMVFRA